MNEIGSHHPRSRRRDPREFFGLERLLWEDRRAGKLSNALLDQLADAEQRLAAALAEGPDRGSGEETVRQRTRALLEATRTARTVLTAARDALRDREAPGLGPRA